MLMLLFKFNLSLLTCIYRGLGLFVIKVYYYATGRDAFVGAVVQINIDRM